MKNGIHIINPKISICHRTTFYFIFNMNSCKARNTNDLPKITKIKSKILNYVYFIML